MSDGRGPIGKAAKEEQERLERERKVTVEEARKQDPCIEERQDYETNCARSWVSSSTAHNGAVPRDDNMADLLSYSALVYWLPLHRSTTSTSEGFWKNVRG